MTDTTRNGRSVGSAVDSTLDAAARGTPEDESPRPVADPLVGLGARLSERVIVWLRWVGGRRLATGAGALVVVAALGWWLLRSPATPIEANLPMAPHATANDPATVPAPTSTQAAATGPPATGASVIVHVAGAVAAPGVYELPAASRVGDAIGAAGGARPDGDPDALNLAAPVLDGDRIAVPVAGTTDHDALAGLTHAADGGASTGPVDLNQATVDQLDALPGVGPATAAAIVAHREANGPFVTVEDLESVRGIGPAKLESLRPLVTV